MFQNTYGFGRDSAKADKELGDFKNLFFNADASAAAAPMEVRGAGWAVCIACRWHRVQSTGECVWPVQQQPVQQQPRWKRVGLVGRCALHADGSCAVAWRVCLAS